MARDSLHRIELHTLVAALRLGDDAYGVTIHDEIERVTGGEVSITGIYSALDRLERAGLVRPWWSEPRPERGGRARRHYRVTAGGRTLVRRERELATRLWRDLSIELPERRR